METISVEQCKYVEYEYQLSVCQIVGNVEMKRKQSYLIYKRALAPLWSIESNVSNERGY